MLQAEFNECAKCATKLAGEVIDWLDAWQFNGTVAVQRDDSAVGWSVTATLQDKGVHWDEDIMLAFLHGQCDNCKEMNK